MKIGSRFVAESSQEGAAGCRFAVWAPLLNKVSVEIVKVPAGEPSMGSAAELADETTSPGSAHSLLPMTQDARGYWHAIAPNLPAGTQYRYQIEDAEGASEGALASWPDPASDFQPEGVHGPSEVVDHSAFDWQDDGWQGIELADYIIYELHVGTFTPEGTFAAAIARLPDLVSLGITAVEIMPVAQFPGDRNWGYDGVFPFAVQNSYGGPTGLKQLVNACHQHGLSVVLDVVYNHFGPEGNYTGKYGPYTTERYRTPWGNAINFDDAYSDGVRHYFIQNALSWLRDYHIDALRLDAVHAIYDFGARHFLQALAEATAHYAKDRPYPAYLIAESDLNDPRLVRSINQGGYQLNAQWSDDFHHALHTRLTGETIGYYSDFTSLETLAEAIKNRFAYAGQYSPFRRRDHGSSALDLPSDRFVVCSQNHDQVGNRMTGDRFSTLISFAGQKLAASMTLLSPYIPLLFMGEEYGENAPFLYFVDHGDPDLIESVRAGRKEEFRAFHSEGAPPDPASLETFKASTLNWPSDLYANLAPSSKFELKDANVLAAKKAEKKGNSPDQQALLLRFYQRLIQIRHECQIMAVSQQPDILTHHTNDILYFQRKMKRGDLLCIMNFGERTREVELPLNNQTWQLKIYSADAEWSADDGETEDLSSVPEVLEGKTSDGIAIAPLSIALYQARE
ncbi:MAG: malto-oligosyltrehalose trehalohydrolase [Phormidesmis sp.]